MSLDALCYSTGDLTIPCFACLVVGAISRTSHHSKRTASEPSEGPTPSEG